MKVLIACEMSGTVRDAFRKKGHDAFSCDIQDSEIYSPYHIKGDVLEVLNNKWDLLIAHPPCTYLTIANNMIKISDKNYYKRYIRKIKAFEFFMKFVYCDIQKICVENPPGAITKLYRKADQYIQPFWFGDLTPKRTGLWLKNLPLLKPTNIVEPVWFWNMRKNGKLERRSNFNRLDLMQTMNKKELSNFRSKTFQGIADAMADQWG